MFWKKKKKTDVPEVAAPFGNFVWDGSSGTWSCDVQHGEGTLVLWYEGTPLQAAHVARFQQILIDIEVLSKLGLDSSTGDIESYGHSPNDMELIGAAIDPSEGDEEFSMSFGFRKWPDGALTVHFRGRTVVASHIDD